VLASIERTREQVQGWEAVVRGANRISEVAAAPQAEGVEGAERGDGSSGTEAKEARRWRLPELFADAPEIPRVTVESAEELEALVRMGKPVVLRGLQRAAGFAPAEQWTREALARSFGDEIVKVSVSQSGRFDGPEDGSKWGLSEKDEVLVRPPETHMLLRHYLWLLEQPTAEAFYLEYNALHQYLGERMRRLAPIPPQARWMRPLLTNLWLGRGATTSPLHYDEYENLLSQVAGTKELLLFPPSDLPYLYYTPRVKGELRYEWPGRFTRVGTSEHRVVFASSVNVSHPDHSRHPQLVRASPLRCTLVAGETLYLPAYWHHEVHSHAARDTVNAAINHWFRNESAPPQGF